MATVTAPAIGRMEHTRSSPERLFSLDLFRGITIAAMIVVNNQSSDSAYWPLQHANVERLDADRPDLPILPVHRRRVAGLLLSTRAWSVAIRGAHWFFTPFAAAPFSSPSAWRSTASPEFQLAPGEFPVCWNESPLSIVPRC